MPGTVTQFVDFLTSSGDTGESNDASIQPIVDGELVSAAVQGRVDQNLRRRTEALRAAAADSAYLRDADRSLIIAGPGKVTWPGSTTAAASGIPVLSDVLWILPMLTPGSAQTAPIPPVASAFGTLHLKRDGDSLNSILVTSQRRSYADGDRINVTVIAGASFACVLDAEDAGTYRRTIRITATPTTTLGDVITALEALTPPAPDNTQLVTAALEGGAVSGDGILIPQARQFVAGNYDGEGHALPPANLASFFSSNPSEALAEGDTLCAQFAMLTDTASTGGRRQATPENSNTPITAGMLFNSRVHPEKLVNALPICKVVNGRLVFGTGVEVAAGAVAVDLGGDAGVITYAGGPAWFDGTTNPATTVAAQLSKIISDLGVAAGAVKIGIAALGAWADGTTNPSVSIQAQLAKIISDLAGAAGTAKIQGVANGTDLAVGTLKAQLDDLSTNWLKMGRANTIGAAQTFSSLVTANAGLTVVGYISHGPKTINIHPSAGTNDLGGTTWRLRSNGAEVDTGTGSLLLPVPLCEGDRFKSMTFRWEGTAEQGEAFLQRLNADGSEDPIDSLALPLTATWDEDTLVLSGDGVTLGAGQSFVIRVDVVADIGAIPLRIGTVSIVYDRPPV